MKLKAYLSERVKEVLTQGQWIAGTNFKAQIIDLDWNKAIQKVDHFNTIASITFHIHYYISGVTKVFKGGSLDIRDKFSFDAPPIQSKQDWIDLVNRFCDDSEQFIALVENMSDEQLLSNFVDEKYGTYYRNIDIIIEHTYYHLGQIILIKKRLQ